MLLINSIEARSLVALSLSLSLCYLYVAVSFFVAN